MSAIRNVQMSLTTVICCNFNEPVNPYGHMQAGVTGGPEGGERNDHPLFQLRHATVAGLQHHARCQVAGVTEQVQAGSVIQGVFMPDSGIKRSAFGFRL